MERRRPSSLSVTYYDPEAEQMPDETEQPTEALNEPPKRRGRPPGSKNTTKQKSKALPWFKIWRCAFWGVAALVSVVSLYRGVEGWLGQSIAYVVLSAAVIIAAFLLDRDWKKMRG